MPSPSPRPTPRWRSAFALLLVSLNLAGGALAGAPGIPAQIQGELNNLSQQARVWYGRDLFRAMESLHRLTERVESLRPQMGMADDDTRAFFARWMPAYKELARLQVEVHEHEAALLNIERAKARALIDQIRLRDAENWARLTPEDRQALKQAEESLSAARADASPEAEQARTARALDYAKLIQRLSVKYTDFMARVRGDAPSLAALRQALPEDALYLSIGHEANAMVVVGLTREGSAGRVLREGPHWKQTATAYHKALSRPDGLTLLRREGWAIVPQGAGYVLTNAEESQGSGVRELEVLANWFGEELLKPVLSQFPNKRRLIISPDGPLYLLPFEAMRLNGRWLIQDYEVSYTLSASTLLLSKERQARYARLRDRLPLLVVGGGEYEAVRKLSSNMAVDARLDRPQGEARQLVQDQGRIFLRLGDALPPAEQPYARKKSKFDNLPASERESEKVAALFPGAHKLLGSRASEQDVMNLERSGDLARYRYVLLSAHGVANTANPWHSAIVLSQNGGGQEDGFITAAEWQGMHLRSDLTVLAACESGLGPVHRGEGLLGLPYAFTLAGAANVAQTLWSVGDRSTAETVTNLFERLSAGQNPSQALTQAKRDALVHYGGDQPYYWAPLVMYGY